MRRTIALSGALCVVAMTAACGEKLEGSVVVFETALTAAFEGAHDASCTEVRNGGCVRKICARPDGR
jgi:hypothetical protein